METLHPTRKVACRCLVLPDGTEHLMCVAEFDANNRFIDYHPLLSEEPFVEWYNGTLVIDQDEL